MAVIMLRVTDELKKEIRAKAGAQDKSMNQYILDCIQYCVEYPQLGESKSTYKPPIEEQPISKKVKPKKDTITKLNPIPLQEALAEEFLREHAPNCPCLMCKPPKKK